MFKINRSNRNKNKVEVKFYKAWVAMRHRCLGKTSYLKKHYLDRGVTVCERWQNFDYFFIDMWDFFLLHIEMFGKDTELDRVNNDKGYFKENCRWATRSENQSNKSNTKLFRGETLAEWSRKLKINRRTLARRYYALGWSIEETLSTPLLVS